MNDNLQSQLLSVTSLKTRYSAHRYLFCSTTTCSKIQFYADDSELHRDAATIEQFQTFERDILAVNDLL